VVTPTDSSARHKALHAYIATIRSRDDLASSANLIIDKILDHSGVNKEASSGVRRLWERVAGRSLSTINKAIAASGQKDILVERRSRGQAGRLPEGVLSTLGERD
jgi:hypothetical protein